MNPIHLPLSSTTVLPATIPESAPPIDEYEETDSGLLVPSCENVTPLPLVGAKDRLPMEPSLPSGQLLEEAVLGKVGDARLGVILSAFGMTPQDLTPYPTLDKNDPLLHETFDREKFFHDFRYICESFFWIPTKQQGIVPFKLNPCQIYFINNRSGRDIILKGRQHGFTTLMLALYFWNTITNPATTTFVVAHEREAAEKAVSRMKDFYECLPEWLRPKLRRDRLGHMVFDAIQSEIRVQVVKDKGGRSFCCNNLFCTEVAFWEIEEEKLSGLLESVPVGSGGSITLESTPDGVGNYFHKECSAAKLIDGESQFKFFSLPWYLNPEYDDAWVETKKRSLKYETTDLGKRQWNQEYCCSFERSQRNYFEKDQCVPRALYLVKTHTDPLEETYPKWCWIFREPVPGEQYVLGADTSQGLEDGDFNCASIISRKTRHEVAVLYGKMKSEAFAHCIYWAARKYNTALVGVEAMGTGHTVLHILFNELFYPNLFFHPNEYNPRSNQLGSLGWQTNRRTRPVMLSEMREALAEKTLALAFDRRQVEMEVFRLNKQGKPEAPPGFHDDTVIAAAITHRLLDFPDMIVDEEMELAISAIGG